MKCTTLPIRETLPTVGPEHSAGRAPGLHLSTLYGGLYQILDPKRNQSSQPDDPTTRNNYMALGLAWEDYLEKRLLADGIDARRPPPGVSPEGIHYSPDLLIHDHATGERILGEIKLTFMAAADSLDDAKFDKWMTQAKGYCYLLGTPLARFYVMFAAGDYKQARAPIFRQFDLVYSSTELADNWQMLLNFARHKGML